RAVEMTDFDDGTGDSTEKGRWLDSHPEAEIEAEIAASANEDGTPSDTSTGVLETTWSPFGGKYAFENSWQDFSADGREFIEVYAGDYTGSPCTGVLVVNELPADGDNGNLFGRIRVFPGRDHGTLHITRPTREIVHFSDDIGEGTYDVETRAFGWSVRRS